MRSTGTAKLRIAPRIAADNLFGRQLDDLPQLRDPRHFAPLDETLQSGISGGSAPLSSGRVIGLRAASPPLNVVSDLDIQEVTYSIEQRDFLLL